MQKIEIRLTVFFENPFWIGVLERTEDGRLEVCKITFGAQPKDYEVHEFLLRSWPQLVFSPAVDADTAQSMRINPKRMQRRISRQLMVPGIGTKAQQALKLQQEENKTLRIQKGRMQKEEEQQLKFELRQQKRKEKHRGH